MECPSCHHKLSWLQVREDFHCSQCGTALHGKYFNSVFWIWIGVWVFGFSLIFLVYYDFRPWAIGVDLLLGAALYAWLFRNVKVELKKPSSGQSQPTRLM